jgi:hypothetical protein
MIKHGLAYGLLKQEGMDKAKAIDFAKELPTRNTLIGPY